MQYFVTIYIDILFEKSLVELDATHAFLGLTRKHPNVLDTMKYEKEITYKVFENNHLRR